MGNLSKNQNRLLSYLKKYISAHGEAPTLEETAKHLKTSIPAAQQRIKTLQLKGYITKGHNKPRGIEIVETPESQSVILPVLGMISAGDGLTVFEDPDPELLEVPVSMVNTYNSHYCLRVDGTSMIEDGIMDGDYVVIRQQTTADNGDTVVAIIHDDSDEKANLKRFYIRGNKIELRPRNKDLSSKFYKSNQVEIRGVFRGLIRKPN